MFCQDILSEIDETLDRLICNAEVLQKVDLEDLSETEIDAFQKTQESLLHHLIHMDERLNHKKIDKRSASIKIQEKRTRFEKLKLTLQTSFSKRKSKTSFLSKRKSKRFFSCIE